jgi:hypothetical protein
MYRYLYRTGKVHGTGSLSRLQSEGRKGGHASVP